MAKLTTSNTLPHCKKTTAERLQSTNKHQGVPGKSGQAMFAARHIVTFDHDRNLKDSYGRSNACPCYYFGRP